MRLTGGHGSLLRKQSIADCEFLTFFFTVREMLITEMMRKALVLNEYILSNKSVYIAVLLTVHINKLVKRHF